MFDAYGDYGPVNERHLRGLLAQYTGTTVPPPTPFFTIDNVSTTTVNSGDTATLRILPLAPGENIVSATLQCLNNTQNNVSLFYNNQPYCGPGSNNTPRDISIQTLPAQIRLVNNAGQSAFPDRYAEMAIQLKTYSPFQIPGVSTLEIKSYTVGVTVRAPGTTSPPPL